MRMMRTSNPALNANTFNQIGVARMGDTMTLQGTVNKSFVLLGLLIISALWVWGKATQSVPIFEGGEAIQGIPASVGTLTVIGFIGGFVFGFVNIFKKNWAGITASIYALIQGLPLGGGSCYS